MFNRKPKFPLAKVTTGFALGAIVGAVAALLLAPMTGKKLQKKIAGVTDDVVEKVEDGVSHVQATVRRLAKA
jgi:gas vesicle protein